MSQPSEPTYEYVVRDGVRLAYRELPSTAAGPAETGPPVVLVHGLFSAGWSWDVLAPVLARSGRRVVIVELRGHGHSDRVGPYTFDRLAADLSFLLAALDLAQVDLIGHSLGGHVAALVAMREPGRVRRLVVEDAPPPPFPGGRGRRSPWDRSDRYRGPGLRSLPPRSRLLLMAFLTLRYRWVRRHVDLPMAKEVLREFRRPDARWWADLARLQAPTLLVHGGRTSHVPGYRLVEMTRVAPDCRLVTWGVGHRVHQAEPERFARLVDTFLDTTRPAERGRAPVLTGGYQDDRQQSGPPAGGW